MRYHLTEGWKSVYMVLWIILGMTSFLFVTIEDVQAQGDHLLFLTAKTQQASLAGKMEVLIDPEGSLTFEEASSPGISSKFQLKKEFFSTGFTQDIIWHRFTVIREKNAQKFWFLEIGPPYLNDIQIYIPTTLGSTKKIQLGDHTPFEMRPIKTRLHTMKLELPEAQPVTVYIRLTSNSTLAFAAFLWTQETLIGEHGNNNLFFGIYYGCLIIVIIIYFAFGLWLKDQAMLAYAAYVTALFFLYLNINGFAAMVVPGNPPWLNDAFTGTAVFLSMASLSFMWDRFLDCKNNFPRAHWIFITFTTYCLLAIPSSITHSYGQFANPAFDIMKIIMGLGMILAITLLVQKGRDVSLIFYFSAFIATLGGVFVYLSAVQGRIPFNFFTINSLQISSLFHISILSIGLAYRIRKINQERRTAKEEAQEAIRHSREQRNFVAMLSHEFRSPLASISQAAQMVQITEPQFDKKSGDRLNRIKSRASQLSSLIDTFLDNDALARGVISLSKKEISVKPFLQSVIELLPCDDRLVITVTPQDATIIADEVYLSNAVGNLITNGLKYSFPDSQVIISAHRTSKFFIFSIINEGVGMSDDEIAQVGTIYFRAESSEGKQGRGIGLYLTKKIADAHGGSLKINSRRNKSTTISINLPL
jgi:two-component system, sensor histidine kinase LadS